MDYKTKQENIFVTIPCVCTKQAKEANYRLQIDPRERWRIYETNPLFV
jgi:hypothetical protein